MELATTRSGLGIRPELFKPMFEQLPDFGFIEAHSENYFGDSISRVRLRELREHYALSLHGVGLSLGRADNLDDHHLTQLKALVDELDPFLVSEHLAWSAYSHRHVPDLLPLPLTEESLGVMCEHVDKMQMALGRQVLVENPSNYLLFEQLQIPEPEFLTALADRTGCGLLVDINNIRVSASNVRKDPYAYINQLNPSAIQQYHLAGYTEFERDGEQVLIDTHNQPVPESVWTLFYHAVETHGSRPTLFEWDSDFPEFETLINECKKADEIILTSELTSVALSNTTSNSKSSTKPEPAVNGKHDQSSPLISPVSSTEILPLKQLQQTFLDKVLSLDASLPQAVERHQARLWIYQNNVYGAIREYLEELFPATRGVVGTDFFKQMTQSYIQQEVPAAGNIYLYGGNFASVISQFSALEDLPYLMDLMEYEWALHTAYFASIDDTIELAAIVQDELIVAPLTFNPSVGLIISDYPIQEIHRQSLPTFTGDVSINLQQSNDALLVYKRDDDVVTRELTEIEAAFLQQLKKSDTILQAIENVSGCIEKNAIATETLPSVLAMVFDLKLLALDKGPVG